MTDDCPACGRPYVSTETSDYFIIHSLDDVCVVADVDKVTMYHHHGAEGNE